MNPISVLAGPTVVAPERLREGMERAVRERVAVDGEERLHCSDASSSVIFALSRSVAACAASSTDISVEVVEHDRVAEDDLQLGQAAELGGAGDAGRDERDARLERDACGTRAPARLVPLAQALLAPRALGEHHDDVPLAAELDSGLDRLQVVLAHDGPGRRRTTR